MLNKKLSLAQYKIVAWKKKPIQIMKALRPKDQSVKGTGHFFETLSVGSVCLFYKK